MKNEYDKEGPLLNINLFGSDPNGESTGDPGAEIEPGDNEGTDW